jgi:hydrogenase expression/formation protein HypC
MCLALPARVISVDSASQSGQVDLGGMRKNVSFALLDEVAVDDYVIVHVGYAISRLDPDEAARTLALFAELAAQQAQPATAEPARHQD